LIPIVAETEQIANRGNSCLKSKAQLFDGAAAGKYRRAEMISALFQ
jgi:hypothetical protein